ncbi:RNA polymerase subunit sigma-70 [Planctomycetaceae bacterium SCGC AG-212-F19]|nr:RNA polymerase subunit sigma-70 [Planctomycetaceae bacterium SCGC AG-212-F19]
MPDALLTRASLLVRLRDPQDRPAWEQFVELYGSVVYRFVRRRGLQDADAADLTQEVLQAVAQSMGRWQYDPAQGTFRGWLFGMTRHKIAHFLQRRQRQAIGSGDTGANQRLGEAPCPEGDGESTWDQEYQEQLFRLAAEHVRPSFAPATWQAFWMTAVEGKSAAEVGSALGLSVGAVYVAKSRVLARLAERVQELQAE